MTDRKALASALDWEWELVRDVQSGNPNPGIAKAGVDMVHLVFAAARERLRQLPETCTSPAHPNYACTTCYSIGAPGKAYPPETVELIARVLSDDDFDHGHCDFTHHIDEAIDVLKVLNGEMP